MNTLLLISAHFPPSPFVGGMRAAAFTRRLPRLGWHTCVVTLRMRPAQHGAATPCTRARRIERTWGANSRDVFAIAGRYPSFVALPDGYVSWLPFAVARSLRVIRQEKPAVLMTSGPPSTAHCIGLAIKRLTGLPWLADLRDPWQTTAGASRLYAAVDARLERLVMSAADRIVATTSSIAADLCTRLGAGVADKVDVIANGYDEELFAQCVATPAVGRFTIAHIGSVTGYRDAGAFLSALRDCLAAATLPPDTQVIFLGGGDAAACAALQRATDALQLASHVTFQPRCQPDEAVMAMQRASALLLLQCSPAAACCIPTKAFEYLRSGRPVLCLAPDGSEVRELLSRFEAVFSSAPDNVPAIRAQLEAAYRSAQADGPVRRDVDAYSRQAAAVRLAALLDALASRCSGALR